MAVKTYTEQLEEIQTAISKVLTKGQAYTIEGRQLTRVEFKAMVDEEKRLRVLADREANGGGIRVRGMTPSQ